MPACTYTKPLEIIETRTAPSFMTLGLAAIFGSRHIAMSVIHVTSYGLNLLVIAVQPHPVGQSWRNALTMLICDGLPTVCKLRGLKAAVLHRWPAFTAGKQVK